MAKKQPSKKQSYEQIGRMVENIYESGYIDRNQMYKTSFIKGVVTGFGGVIGATIVVALIATLLNLLGYVRIIKPVVEPIRDTLQSQKK